MLLFLSLFGILLSVILLIFSNARRYSSSVYLSLFFLLTSLYGFYQYILLYSKSELLVSYFLFNLSVAASPIYLIGPMIFWYIRSVLTDSSKLVWNDVWHFLPMLIYFIAAIPNAFIPWHEKVEVARSVIHDRAYLTVYHATLLNKIMPPVLIYLSRLFLIFIYTAWSLVLLIRYLKTNKASAVLSKQQFMKSWLFHLLGFLLILVVSQIFLVKKSFDMHFSDLFFTLNIIRIISVVGLIGLLVSPFFFPAILYGLPRMPEEMEEEKDTRITVEPKRFNVSFESDYLELIGQKTDIYMKEHQFYLDPGCNLAYISKKIDIPAHHLAYYFREEKKQRFNDYRNEWRVNHAKRLIREGKANEITLEAIGSLSGFSSRNAFITDFKKAEGISPGAYAARYN